MPLTLFCHNGSSEDVFNFFSENNAIVEREGENWNAMFQSDDPATSIRFNFDAQWCSDPNWSTQKIGMANFVGQFAEPQEKLAKVRGLIHQLKYTIGIECEPEIEDGSDWRLEVVHAIADQMQGIIFSPSAILDSHFRAIIAADGGSDPEAILPTYEQDLVTTPETSLHPQSEEEFEFIPPSADRVAKRAYVMLAVVARGLLEMNLNSGNEPAYTLEDLHKWFEQLNLNDEIEVHERQILYTPAKQLSQQDTLNSIWSIEGLTILAWTLKLAPAPKYDSLVDVDQLLGNLSFMDTVLSQSKIANPSLRAAEEIQTYNDQIFAFNWRMVDFRVRPEPIDYANVSISLGKLDLSQFKLIDGDLAIQGQVIHQAPADLVGTMSSMAQERHKASNWLIGESPIYSDVSTNT